MDHSNTPAPAGPGSPLSGEPVYLVIGFLRRPHGLRGELLMDLHTDEPGRLRPGKILHVGEGREAVVIASRRMHGQAMLIAFEGVEDCDQAARFRNQWVYVSNQELPALPDGEYYHYQLIGLQVLEDESGNILGELKEVLETGANDVYVVARPDGRELLLPAIPPVVLNISLEQRQMRVHLLPGLIEEDKR
jgi:16S rRNA processing protein RimM